MSLASCRRLDHKSSVPLYYQLAATLLENLEAGGWPEGVRFPTERELEAEFDTSRTVVRRALDLLVGDGAIRRTKGSGTFVAARRHKIPIFGLIEALMDHRDTIGIRLFAASEESPDRAVAKFLELDVGQARVAHVTAVLSIEGQPVGIVDSHTPIGRVPWVIDAAKALGTETVVSMPRKLELTRAEVIVEHTFFGQWGGPKLGVAAGDSAFLTRFIQFGRTDRRTKELPLEFTRLIYPSDTCQISFELRKWTRDPPTPSSRTRRPPPGRRG